MSDLPASPYPGIRPFREEEEYLFFGRETQVDAMVDTLARGRFLAVIGSSGCGKSSLVNCGLRPALHRGLLTRAGSAWRMASCRPGGHPLRALAKALAAPGALHRETDGGLFTLAEFIETTLAMSRRGLVETWQQARLPEGTQLLVIVDQFEELFRYRQLADASPADEDPATAFVNLLLQARAEEVPIHIVLTMRSDFLGDCARFAGLPEAINGGQYLVPRMSRDDRRAAILGPARVCGADIEPTLLTRLVNDVGDDPDQLSLLQHALARCWAHWRASGEPSPIEARHYDAVGTLAHALNQHAEEIFTLLPAAHQLRCAATFRALTDTSTDARGIRRPTRFSELDAITAGCAEAAAAPLHEVLAPFRAPGAAFLMPPAGEGLAADTVIDISHESLMRIWDRLRDWGEREADAARMLRRLADAAELHAAGQASLWRDPELQLALDWRTRNHLTPAWARQYGRTLSTALAFLDASAKARDEALATEAARLETARAAEAERIRSRRVGRLTLAAVVAATVVAGATGVLWQRAEHASKIAVSRQFAAQSAAELTSGNLPRALQLAAAGYTHQASFEARDSLLAALSDAPLDWRHAGQRGVLALAVGPDGMLASGGRDGSIRFFSDTTAAVPAHQEQVLALAFSPDGSLLASAGIDHRVILWRTADRQMVASLDDHEGPVLALAWSPDGKTLASAGADRRIVLRDGTTGAPVGPALTEHTDTVTGLAFSPDGKTLASTGYDGNLILRTLGDARPGQRSANHPAVLHGLAFSPDGQQIATAGADGDVVLWQADRLTPIGSPLAGRGTATRKVAFSHNGRTLVAVGEDSQVRIHDLTRPGSRAAERPVHRGNVLALAFKADGSFVTAGSDDLLIRHGLSRHGPLTQAQPGATDTAWALAWRPDGQIIASAAKGARIELRDAVSGALSAPPLAGHEAIITSLAWSPDGHLLASAGQEGRLLLWDTTNPARPPLRLIDAGPHLRRVSIRADGRQLAAAGPDGRIRLWRLPDGTALPTSADHGAPVSDLAWRQDGRQLASAGLDGRLRLWEGDGLQPAGDTALPDAGALYRLAWAGGDTAMLIATQRHGLLLWPGSNGPARPLGREGTPMLDLALAPDGQTLASTDKDGRVFLWDMVSGEPLHAPLLRHAGPGLALAWAPDGKRLASAGWKQGVLISRTAAADWTTLACDLVRLNPPEADAPSGGCPSPAKRP
ncbi:MAG TPA: hypothetical protein PLM62_02385 [Zoogloea sp.]|nr:hypothetical protein [Zoogloea sp.]